MKKFLNLTIISSACLLFYSCGSDEPKSPNEPELPTTAESAVLEETYFAQGKEAADLMTPGISITELERKVRDLEFVSSTVKDEGTLIVTTKDGSVFCLDPDGLNINRKPLIEEELRPVSDEVLTECENLMNEIGSDTEGADNTNLPIEYDETGSELTWEGFSNLETIDDIIEEDIPETGADASSQTGKAESAVPLSRGNSPRVVLSRYKMAVWNPWPEFSKETSQVRSAIESANSKAEGHKIAFTELTCGPSSFGEFGNYDLVFLVCHGSPSGRISIPKSLWSSYVDKYVINNENSNKPNQNRPNEKVGKTLDSKKAAKDGIILNFSKDKDQLLESVLLTQKFLSDKLSILNRTIIWTSVCYGGRDGDLKKAMTGKGCPAYIGADNSCTATGQVNCFRNYIYRLAVGGNSATAFNNGKGSAHYNDLVKGGGIASYNIVHSSSSVVSYFRCYAMGPVSNVIKTADVRVRFIYGDGSSVGPEVGMALQKIGGKPTLIPMNNLLKVSASSRVWGGCARVHDTVLRFTNLEAETNYFCYPYCFDGFSKTYSTTGDTFHTDGLEGDYKFRQTTHYFGDEAEKGDVSYDYEKIYFNFTEEQFDINKHYGQWAFYGAVPSGNSITFHAWTEPYYGGCGAEWHSTYNGYISEDWSYMHVTSPGWMSWSSPEYMGCPSGPHHHDPESSSSEWYLKKRPTIYEKRKVRKEESQTKRTHDIRTIANRTLSF